MVVAQFVMRLDGFISVNAGYETGEFITKPLIFSGNQLELNFSSAGAGNVRIEIQDADGKAVEGFTLEDSDSLRGDSISQFASWQKNSNLSSLAGKPIRLRFQMNEADLYSIRFPKQ